MKQLMVNVALLRRMGACDDGITDFKRVCPKGLRLTNDQEKNLEVLEELDGYNLVEDWAPLFSTARLGWLAQTLMTHDPGCYLYRAVMRHWHIGTWEGADPAGWAAMFAYFIDNLKRTPGKAK